MAGSQPFAKVWRLKPSLVDLLTSFHCSLGVHGARLHSVICQASKNRPTWRAVRKRHRVDMSWNVALPCRLIFHKCFNLKSLNLVDRELSNSEAPHLLLQTFLLTLFTFFFFPISWNQKLLVTSGLEIEKGKARDFKSVVFMSKLPFRFCESLSWKRSDELLKVDERKDIPPFQLTDQPCCRSVPSIWQRKSFAFFLMVDFCRTFSFVPWSSQQAARDNCVVFCACREDDADGTRWESKTLPNWAKHF